MAPDTGEAKLELAPHLLERKATPVAERPTDRLVEMQVLNLGLMRTGTTSIRQALYDLGYSDVYHMRSVHEGTTGEADTWIRALDATYGGKGKRLTKKEWDQLLGYCEALTDMPGSCFPDELVAAYPDAKVILSVRDSPEAWFESVNATTQYMRSKAWFMNPGILAEIFIRVMRMPSFMVMRKRMFQYYFYDNFAKNGIPMYEKHIENIKALVPPEKLLVFNPKEGWEPLCRFLGKEVPKEKPFPKLNDREQFIEWAKMMEERAKESSKGMRYRALLFGLLAVGFGLLMWQGDVKK